VPSPQRSFRFFRIVRPGIVRSGITQPGVVNPRITPLASPDLTAEPEVVIDNTDTGAALRSASGGRHAGGSSADHENFEVLLRFPAHLVFGSRLVFQFSELQFSVVTCIPCSHST
jgi:hypothetical protein